VAVCHGRTVPPSPVDPGLQQILNQYRDGSQVTGTYRVLQPDGCIRVVRYTADAMGFQPTVTYEGDCANNKSGSDGPAAADETGSARYPRDLESMAREILDAMIPEENPAEVNTETPAEVDLPGVMMDIIPVILPSHNAIPVPDAIPEGGSDPESGNRRCWYPVFTTPAPSPVIVEEIPEAVQIPEATTAPEVTQDAEEEEEEEEEDDNDAIITEAAEFAKSIRRPDVHSSTLIYGSPPVGRTGTSHLRTYLIRTPARGGLFRQHPKLIPYKIKQVWQASGPPPSGKLIHPILN